jgi:hypothetical protein
MDEAGGIRLPAAEEAPSAPASAPSTEAVLIAASGGGSGRARGERVKAGRVGGPTRSGLRLGQSDSGAWADGMSVWTQIYCRSRPSKTITCDPSILQKQNQCDTSHLFLPHLTLPTHDRDNKSQKKMLAQE